MKKKIYFVLLFGILMFISMNTNAQISLLKDINTTLNTGGSDPNSFIEMRGILYFVATDPSIGTELWRTDGTTLGTYLVKDIKQGSGSSIPTNLFVYKDTLYFSADDGLTGREIWKSDGTEGGTDILADIYPGSSKRTPYSSNPANFLVFNDTLYFSATGPDGTELYKTDGSDSRTKLAVDIYTGSSGWSANSSKPQYLTLGKGCFYFQAINSSTTGVELFKSNGTLAGTVLVKNINTYNKKGSNPRKFINMNDTIYFLANDSTHGEELWKTDGTDAGTMLVKDINTNALAGSSIANIVIFKNKLYFQAEEGTAGAELWMSNGTAAGTSRVIDIYTGTSSSYPSTLTVFNGSLYFTAQEAAHGFELWKSDGTLAGTALFKDINIVAGTGSSPDLFMIIGSKMVFVAQTSVGNELWVTDGTATNTTLLKDIWTGNNSSNPQKLCVYNNKVFLSADNGSIGREPWLSDGTPTGTLLLKDIVGGTISSDPAELTEMNGYIYFSATSTTSIGCELYRTNGTTAGTLLFKDMLATANSSSTPKKFINVNNILYFTANNGNGYELWRSDGTVNGTKIVKVINNGIGSDPDSFCVINNIIYFSAFDGTNGKELWRSDGTTAGTTLVKNINPGSASSYPYGLTNVNGKLFFTANDGTNGEELWKSDGTDTGTKIVKNIRTGSASSSPDYIYSFNGKAYFQADDGMNGVELWKSDGTSAGTIMLKNIYTGNGGWGGGTPNSSYPMYFADLNGKLYFQATSNNVGTEIWRTDGTDTGTKIFKDIYTGSGYGGANSSNPQNLTKVSNKIYFTAKTKNEGTELWKTDGTLAGTILAKDINVGSKSSNPYNFLIVGNSLYFGANDGINGVELWKSENNTCGKIVLTGEINSGTLGTGPTYLASMNGVVYFAASNASNGNEIWKYTDTYIPAYTTNLFDTICSGDSIKTGKHYYKTTGIFKDTLLTINGCDSLIVTNLKVNQTNSFNKALGICIGDSIKIGGVWRKSSGSYTDNLLTIYGCDSIINYNLTLSPKPPKPVIHKEGGATMVSSSATGNQWYEENGTKVVGGTQQKLTKTDLKKYYVIVTIDGCSSEPSNSFNPTLGSINNDLFSSLDVYPNPVSGKLTIELKDSPKAGYYFSINNMEGKEVLNGKLTETKNEIDVRDVPLGIYFVKIIMGDKIGLIKIVKE